jgi:prepilin-type N-terminal cleavage/methylation domain-containing protein
MRNDNAFTLLEILVSLFIFSLIGAIIGGGFIIGNRINRSQEGIIEIQQNLRVAVLMMSRDIRMIGFEYNPHWSSTMMRSMNQIVGEVTPTGSTSNGIQFNYLVPTTPAGVPSSMATIRYFLDNAGNLQRTYNDGVNPATTDQIASNIDAVWISYLDNSGNWNDMPVNPPTVTPASWVGVPVTRAVSVTIVSRSTRRNEDIHSAMTFTEPNLPEGEAPTLTLNDGFDHRMITTVVQLNNLNSEL